MNNLDNLDLDSIDNELKSINLELGNDNNSSNDLSNNDVTDIGLDLLANKNKGCLVKLVLLLKYLTVCCVVKSLVCILIYLVIKKCQ